MSALEKAGVFVGIPSDSEKNRRDDTPQSNAEIAFINEYGEPSEHIPARPFLFPGIIKAMPKNQKIMLGTLKRVFTLTGAPREAVEIGLNAVGVNSQQEIQDQIVNGDFVELSKYTLQQRKARGFMGEKPLIETGSLKAAITYVVDND